MPNVITFPETIETDTCLYEQKSTEHKPVLRPVSQSRFLRLLGFLRVCLWPPSQDEVVLNGERYDSGMDMLSQKHPYLFIRTLCG